MIEKIDNAIQKLKLLGKQNNDICSILSFGSSTGKKQDEYSDIDIFLFTTTPIKYLIQNNNDWLLNFEEILSRVVIKDVIDNILLNRIIFKNGLSLDVIAVDITEFKKGKYYFMLKKYHLDKVIPKQIKETIDANIYNFHYYLKRGYEIIYDKISIDKMVRKIFNEYEGKVDKDNFVNEVKFEHHYIDFWHTCYKINIKLIENDFFNAIVVLDNSIKRNLIRLVEWYILSENENVDVLYKGIKLKQWCDPAIIDKLYTIFPHSNSKEIRISVLNSMKLYSEIALALAIKKGYEINTELEKKALKAIKHIDEEPVNRQETILQTIHKIKTLAQKNSEIKEIISLNPKIKNNPSELNIYLIAGLSNKYLKKELWSEYFDNIYSITTQRNNNHIEVQIILGNRLFLNINILSFSSLEKTHNIMWLKKRKIPYVISKNSQREFRRINNLVHNTLKRDYDFILGDRNIKAFVKQIFDYNSEIPISGTVSQLNFYKNYHQFWQTSHRLIIKLIREDFFYAIVILDNLIKKLLLEMMEWFSLMKNPGQDVFYEGNNMQQWCENNLIKNLMETFLNTSIQDMKNAAIKTLNIYKMLSHSVAKTYNFELNEELETMVFNFIADKVK